MSGGVPAVLAIDGGNSKTDVALVAADGTVRGRARGRGGGAAAVARRYLVPGLTPAG